MYSLKYNNSHTLFCEMSNLCNCDTGSNPCGRSGSEMALPAIITASFLAAPAHRVVAIAVKRYNHAPSYGVGYCG